MFRLKAKPCLRDNYSMGGHSPVLRVLIFRDNHANARVIQALERDIAAYGPSVEAAKTAFERTLSGHFALDRRRNRPPLSALKEAPAVFWDAWARASKARMDAEAVPHIDAYMIPAITDERDIVAT